MKQMFEQAIWVCKNLFQRNKVSGSSANMSFRVGNKIYITASGTSFGTLEKKDFSIISINGEHLEGKEPSKELELHLSFYKKDKSIQCVIHTHSFYATLWSSLEHSNLIDCIPEYTPYLKMKLGSVAIIPYFKPGTKELFSALDEKINLGYGFLLSNHGPIIGAKNIMEAFGIIEELEESSRIAWEFEGKSKIAKKINI